MAAGFCKAINDWIAAEWLSKDTRLSASIVVPLQAPDLAVEEIERRAGDDRFVSVLVLSQGETLLGRRHFWPVYQVAEKYRLPIAIHAGSQYRGAPSSIGWPSYRYEYYLAEAQAFQAQILSLIYEGVFGKFPGLKVVLMESGVSWLPAFMWRANKTWRGVRVEVPWVEREPAAIIRDHVRVTMQPFDSPPDATGVADLIDQIGCDKMFLFASDYPHWQFDGDDAVPPHLSKRWQEHTKTYGDHLRTPYIGTTPYPRSSPLIARRDAWPPTGGPPGSDLAFMRKQHLDPLDVEFGILQVLDLFIFSQQNLEFGAAIQRAVNEWQLAHWCSREPRLKASILVGQDDTEAAVAEIERCAKLGQYVQINVSPRANEPLGRRRYWPIYQRAEELGLPLGIHVGGYGGHAPTGSGWPSYYCEEHQSNAHSMAATLTSLVIEGVPERFPRLKIVFIEGGFGWIASTMWRMDQHFERFRSEVPHLKRRPSEYVREHFWFTTQPIDEPDEARHLRSLIEWVGVDRLLFSSDYPHWDFDDPRFAFRTPLSETERAKIFNGNARALYKLLFH